MQNGQLDTAECGKAALSAGVLNMNCGSFAGKQDANRRSLMIGRVLLGAVGALISIGLAAPASADPVTTAGAVGAPQPDAVTNFLAAARAAGITGTDPAMLGDGYSVCRQLWNQGAPGTQVAADLVRDNPQLTSDQAGQFVLAAYHSLCPAAAAYDYWAYSTS
jgi:hypothetical protein